MTIEIPQPIKDHIASLEADATDLTNAPEHRSFLRELLNVLYKFLPVVISLFHKSGGTAIPDAPHAITPVGQTGSSGSAETGVKTD